MGNYLPLTGIVDVSVSLTPSLTYQRGFNTALILGANSEIPDFSDESYAGKWTAATDVIFYSSLAEVLTDFETTTSVYKAASLYFGQNYVPQGLYVACMSTSSETLVEAITRCRVANSEWYVAIPTDSVMAGKSSSDITETSTYVEGAIPETVIAYSFTSSGYDTILAALKAGNYQRTISQYDDPTNYAANAGKTCIAAIIGYAMGKNNNLSSAYTLAYKSVNGILPIDNFTASQLDTLLGLNCNIYINQGYYYNLFRQGRMASGDNFDEIIYLDMMVNQLRTSIMEVLVNNPKVPQTEEGVNTLEASMVAVLERFRNAGFVAEGVWNGQTILALENGDALPSGYLIQFESVASQTTSERAARIAPNCYICVKLAGAIEHVVISIIANK